MTAFAERAQCEKEGEPSCLDWLIGNSNDPPDHVCDVIAQASTAVFAAERDLYGHLYRSDLSHLPPILGLKPPPSPHAYESKHEFMNSWPLPIGKGAIAAWYRLRSVMWGKWPFLMVTSSVLVAQDDAWLGLAVQRVLLAGTVWLLGLVEQVYGYGASAPIDGFAIVSEASEPTSPSLDAAHQIVINEGGSWGNRQYARNELWRWADPVILLEAYARTAADLDALTAAVRPLLEWYRARLLGKTLTVTIGRPKGSTTLFVSREDFRAAVKVTIEAIKAGRQPLSQRRVAEQLFPLNKDPEREFIRQRKHWGYPTWEDLKEDCES